MKTIRTRPFVYAIFWAIFCTLITSTIAFAGSTTEPTFLDLGNSDQVILLVGSGLIHQEQFHGYLESYLVQRFPDKKIVCRNLGWSGDTVTGSARTNGYQNPGGFSRLIKQAGELKPDIIFVGYGSVESFNGPAGLDAFKEGYNKLLDALGKLTPKIVLLSPTFHEDLGRPLPNPEAHNKNLEAYTEAIGAIANERGLPFVDLFHATMRLKQTNREALLTDNGILLNDLGYWVIANQIEEELPHISHIRAMMEMSQDGAVVVGDGAVVKLVKAAGDRLNFDVQLEVLPPPPAPNGWRYLNSTIENQPRLSARGLPAGTWTLKIDGREIVSESAEQWATGVTLRSGPDVDQEAELRKLVVERGGLFYRRWNPTNDIPQHYTYIAPDFAMYDAEVAELDKKIAAIARPVSHRYELVRKP